MFALRAYAPNGDAVRDPADNTAPRCAALRDRNAATKELSAHVAGFYGFV